MLLNKLVSFLIYTGLCLMPNEVYGRVYLSALDAYLNPYKIAFGITILVFPFIAVIRNRGIVPFTTKSALQLIFILISFISVLGSENPARSFAITLWLPFYFLVGQTISTYAWRRPNALRNLLAALYLSAVFYSLWGLAVLVAYFQGIDLGQYIGGDPSQFLIVRVTSVTGEANMFGLFLSFVLPIAITFLLASQTFSQFAANCLGIGILMITGILTFSRGLWISIVLVLIAMLLTYPQRKRLIGTSGMILGLGLITIALIARQDMLLPFFQQRFRDFMNMLYLTSGSRVAVWSGALQGWSSTLWRVLFGLGQGSFGNWTRYGIYMEDLRGRAGLLHIHSLYVDALVGNGIFAFAVLLTLLARELVLSWRLLRNKTLEPDKRLLIAAPFYGLYGILAMGLSINVLISPYIWVALALNELGRMEMVLPPKVGLGSIVRG